MTLIWYEETYTSACMYTSEPRLINVLRLVTLFSPMSLYFFSNQSYKKLREKKSKEALQVKGNLCKEIGVRAIKVSSINTQMQENLEGYKTFCCSNTSFLQKRYPEY